MENSVLRYLAVIRAARDFGLSDADIESAVGTFDATRVGCSELADALADLILSRASRAPTGA